VTVITIAAATAPTIFLNNATDVDYDFLVAQSNAQERWERLRPYVPPPVTTMGGFRHEDSGPGKYHHSPVHPEVDFLFWHPSTGMPTTSEVVMESVAIMKGAKAFFPNRTRTNFCKLAGMKGLYAGTAKPDAALAGAVVYIAVNPDVPSYYMVLNASRNYKPVGGFMYSLHTKLAAAGGFTIKYVITPPLSTFSSATVYMQNVLPYVDLYAAQPYPDTQARRAVGIGFTTTVLDQSIVMVTTTEEAPPELLLWAFLNPLSDDMWAGICGVILSYTIVHFFIEQLERLCMPPSIPAPDIGIDPDDGVGVPPEEPLKPTGAYTNDRRLPRDCVPDPSSPHSRPNVASQMSCSVDAAIS